MGTRTMRSADARLACVVAFALATGCGGDDAPAAAAEPGAGEAEAAPMAAGTRDAAAVSDIRLTMDGVHRYADATEAFYTRVAADPALQARMTGGAGEPDAETLDELVRHIESIPEWRREIQRAGLSVGDYTRIMMSLTSVAIYIGFRDMGFEAPDTDTEWISEQNIDFYEQNRAEIERTMQRLRGYEDLFDDDDDPGW